MSKIFASRTKRNNIKYKYGVEVTPNVKESIKFDNENSNTLWKDSIGKEM